MIRLPFAVFLAVFAATALYTFTRPKIYEATATLQLTTQKSLIDEVGIYIKIIESDVMLKKVASRLAATHLENLGANRRAVFDVNNHAVTISCRENNPEISTQVANAFAEELNAFKVRSVEEDIRQDIKDLQARADTQARLVDTQTAALAAPPTPSAPDPAFQALERELAINHDILAEIQARLAEARDYKIPTPFRLTPATPPAPGDYVSPSILLHLALGTLGGALAGLLTARRTAM